jgi:hypothetical protein
MRLVPSRRLVKRDVSYEFMNRQMVWHAFTVSDHIYRIEDGIDNLMTGVFDFRASLRQHPCYPSTRISDALFSWRLRQTLYACREARYFT